MAKSSAIRIQIGIKLDKRANVTAQFLNEVVKYWADSGETPEGIEIVSINWKHPRKPWKTDDAESARHRFARLLQHVTFSVKHIRGG